MSEDLTALRAEVAALRREVADLRANLGIPHYYNGPPTTALGARGGARSGPNAQ